MANILLWTDDRPALIERISRPSTLKILLKTRNDVFFLRRWVEHHLRVVDGADLIIFDNLSTDPEVLAYYDELPDEITIAAFAGFHNVVHDMKVSADLYSALEPSFAFVFLDHDEFLYLASSDRFSTAGLVDYVEEAAAPFNYLPASWINAKILHPDIVRTGTAKTRKSGLMWGKPLIRPGTGASGFINHNVQLAPELTIGHEPTRVVVVHEAYVWPERRIRANIAKLAVRGTLPDGISVADALAVDRSGIDAAGVNYLEEIERMLAVSSSSPALEAGECRIGPAGVLTYFSDVERRAFADFLEDNSAAFIAELALEQRRLRS